MPTYEFDLCVYRPSLDQIVEHWRGMYASRNYTYPRFSLNIYVLFGHIEVANGIGYKLLQH